MAPSRASRPAFQVQAVAGLECRACSGRPRLRPARLRDVAIVLPGRRVAASEMATAATVARSLISSGPHVSFYHGYNGLPELAKPDEAGRWTRGIVLVGPLADAVGVIAAPIAKVAGAVQPFGMLAAVRIAGQPALLVS